MIPRIKSIQPLDNYMLRVTFDCGTTVIYDVKQDIEDIEQFRPLKTEYGLFQQAQLDTSRTCVYWDDLIDLASDSIFEYGEKISQV